MIKETIKREWFTGLCILKFWLDGITQEPTRGSEFENTCPSFATMKGCAEYGGVGGELGFVLTSGK